MHTQVISGKPDEEGSEFELDVGLLEEIDTVLDVAFNPTMPVQPPPFNAAVALEFLAEELSTEIQEGKVTGFSLQWDGGTHIQVSRTVKSSTLVSLVAYDNHKIR